MKRVQKRFTHIRNKLLNKKSLAETHFEKLLINSGLFFRREKGTYKYGSRWSYFDFYIPYYYLFVEIDGSSHNTEKQKRIDKIKENYVFQHAKYIVRLKNKQVLAMESVTIGDLLKMCFSQMAKKQNKCGTECYRKRYGSMFHFMHDQIVSDVYKTAVFEIDEKQEVWMYDNHIGNYFRFDNIIEAKLNTGHSLNVIHALCETKEYKHSDDRRYVFAYTLKDCELRVAQTYY